jgi:hypothetical protein
MSWLNPAGSWSAAAAAAVAPRDPGTRGEGTGDPSAALDVGMGMVAQYSMRSTNWMACEVGSGFTDSSLGRYCGWIKKSNNLLYVIMGQIHATTVSYQY